MVEGPPEYIVSGVAMGVSRGGIFDGTFDILTSGGRTIPAEFFGPSTTTSTFWAYSDNVLQGSQMILDVNRTVAVPAFDNLAEVSARGIFDNGGRLHASHITFTFPHFRIGEILSTWSADNTYFRLDRPFPWTISCTPSRTNGTRCIPTSGSSRRNGEWV